MYCVSHTVCNNLCADKQEFCIIITTRQVTRAMHVRNRICPRVELILKIIIIANYISRIY